MTSANPTVLVKMLTLQALCYRLCHSMAAKGYQTIQVQTQFSLRPAAAQAANDSNSDCLAAGPSCSTLHRSAGDACCARSWL